MRFCCSPLTRPKRYNRNLIANARQLGTTNQLCYAPNMNDNDPDNEIICVILEPDEIGQTDFIAWQQEQKEALEAEGMTITKIEGAQFYGYNKPTVPKGKS